MSSKSVSSIGALLIHGFLVAGIVLVIIVLQHGGPAVINPTTHVNNDKNSRHRSLRALKSRDLGEFKSATVKNGELLILDASQTWVFKSLWIEQGGRCECLDGKLDLTIGNFTIEGEMKVRNAHIRAQNLIIHC